MLLGVELARLTTPTGGAPSPSGGRTRVQPLWAVTPKKLAARHGISEEQAAARAHAPKPLRLLQLFLLVLLLRGGWRIADNMRATAVMSSHG